MTHTYSFLRPALAAALAALILAPVAAHADSRHHYKRHHAAAVQKNKNNMRNLALGGVAVAGYGLATHNSTATVLGAAGAALAGNSYENARKEQSKNSNHHYHYRHR
jgi:hypothetical protein